MACNNYYKAKLILDSNKKRLLKVNPDLTEEKGIYILTRMDEQGFKYAYVGQAKHILSRLAQHLYEYPPQHIDLSLKKHKLYDKDKNPYGWRVHQIVCHEGQDIDEMERQYIKRYALNGYQLRNKTSGGQDTGKSGVDDNRASKGYHEGVAYGYDKCLKEVKEFFDKYLNFEIKEPEGLTKDYTFDKTFVKKYEEFRALLEKVNADGTK